jgi:hypothetical protein
MLKTSHVTKEVIFDFGPNKIIGIKKLCKGTYITSTGVSFTFKQLQESKPYEEGEYIKLPFTLDWKVRRSADVMLADKFKEFIEAFKRVFDEK